MPDDNRNRPNTVPPPIPTRPRPPTQQTALGLQPMAIPSVPRAQTQQPVAPRPPTQQVPVARPPTQRPPTNTLMGAHAPGPYATPAHEPPRAHAMTPRAAAQPPSVLSSRISNHALAYSQTMLPQQPAAPHAPIARAATAPVAGLTRVPHSTPPPPLGTMPVAPATAPATMRAQLPSVPGQPTASLRPVGIVLPPYVPAPNLGDPAEQDATVPVDKMEFTELVERYDPIVIDSAGRLRQPSPPRPAPSPRDSLLDVMPPRFDIRAAGKQILRFWPLIAISALVLVFLGGYMAFDESGRNKPGKTSQATEVKSEAPKSEAPKVAPVVKADEPKPEAKTEEAKPTEAKPEAKTDAKAVKAGDTGSEVAPPKPARGKLYVAGDSSVQIYLNGRSANRTAPALLLLPPGNHKVTLWNQKTGKTTTQWVTVVADKTVGVR